MLIGWIIAKYYTTVSRTSGHTGHLILKQNVKVGPTPKEM